MSKRFVLRQEKTIMKRRRNRRMLKIGMLTSGGDCQALNATMREIGRAHV